MNKQYWQNLRETSIEHMIELNKVIVPLRNKLLGLENQFGAWEAKKIEAERHLVEVIKIRPAKTTKKEKGMIKEINKLSPSERKILFTRLRKKAENNE